MMYTLGVLSIMLAGTLSILSVLDWSRPDPRIKEIQDHPGAIQMFREEGHESGSHSPEVPALVVQAKVFAGGITVHFSKSSLGVQSRHAQLSQWYCSWEPDFGQDGEETRGSSCTGIRMGGEPVDPTRCVLQRRNLLFSQQESLMTTP